MEKTIDKINRISSEDADIGLNYGHYTHLAKLINDYNLKNVIEIGCAYGNLSKYLLENTKLEELISIDPYKAYSAMPGLETQEDYDVLYEYVTTKLVDKYDTRFRLCKQTSDEFIDDFWTYEKFLSFTFYFDMIFIDGDHSYKQVLEDIANYGALLKPGSILSGHDITVFEGVDRAVKEYQQLTGKELHTLPGNIWYFKI